jgi:hypothetical protein
MHFFRYGRLRHLLFGIETKHQQVWFQDLDFRHGVYDCQPIDSNDKFEVTRLVARQGRLVTFPKQETPIFQLQTTFAALQESSESIFNPVKLVESLKLRTTEQQDAQEWEIIKSRLS